MWTSAISTHPWVGNKYEDPLNFNSRTLILGESNYTDVDKFNNELVINCVLDDMETDPDVQRDTGGFCRFSTKLRRLIFGSDSTIKPGEFWHDVAFYNFVQEVVGSNARDRPTGEMWRASIPAFIEVVETLKPSRILVLGQANWSNLLSILESFPIDKFSALLGVGSERIVAGYINHPSSSLTYSVWHPIAKNILDR